MYITAQGPHLRNDLYCVKWDVKLYYTIPYRPVLVCLLAFLHCVICVFCLLVVLVRLSVPVRVIDWKDSSLK